MSWVVIVPPPRVAVSGLPIRRCSCHPAFSFTLGMVSVRRLGSGQRGLLCVTVSADSVTSPAAVGAATVPPSASVPFTPPPSAGVGPMATAASGATSLPSIVTLPRSDASVSVRAPPTATIPSRTVRPTSPGCSRASPLNVICVPPPVSVMSTPLNRYCAGASPVPRAT